MREILFRSKRVDNGEWVEGFVFEREPPLQCFAGEKQESEWYICKTAFADWNMPRGVDFIKVDPFTAGQWTGLNDKNGVKIFEGDIIRGKGKRTFHIEYSAAIASFVARSMDDELTMPCCNYGTMVYYEVIGNIHGKETD